VLTLNNVTIKFGGLVAVDNLSFTINKNEIFGLIGPNGAGKTTVFNAISGVYKPTQGQVLFNESRIDGKQPFEINKAGIARTYQNINLFRNMTVLENVMVGCHCRTRSGVFSSLLRLGWQKKEEKEIKEKSMELLKLFDLKEKANSLASSLSYGEQRELEICRALASEPELLLLDEPAAGMNMAEKLNLAAHIKRIRDKEITILLVEHDMKLVMGITDRILVLNFGKEIARGEPVFIQNNPDVIEAYLGGDL